MKNLVQILIFNLIIFLSISCEKNRYSDESLEIQYKKHPLLFTEGFKWVCTDQSHIDYIGYCYDEYCDSVVITDSNSYEIYDTITYYYAYDSILEEYYEDTVYTLGHFYMYDVISTKYNLNTGKKTQTNYRKDLGLLIVDDIKKIVFYRPWYNLFEHFNFNVNIGDTLEHRVSYATGFPVYYADIIVDTSFVRIGPYRLKRYYWKEIWENDYNSEVKGDYIEGIGTLHGPFNLNERGKLEYYIIDGIKYTTDDIIFED
jgi:hypothetical protein